MKFNFKHLRLAAAVFAIAASASSVFGQLSIPSDGSDGALVVTVSTNIDLRRATTGVWSSNNSANQGLGIYDPEKWAVVFKYSSVFVANGATVTFTNHVTHAPVVWLVRSNVTIDGAVGLNGQGYPSAILNDVANVPEPGPGGFRGGAMNSSPYGLGNGGGFGPGGGDIYLNGSYSSSSNAYGNLQILPLIGGSGGGSGLNTEWSGGAGGGAILIAAAAIISINGRLTANGGFGYNSAAGSGGGIRLIANQLLGDGRIEATGGNGQRPGRIRIETVNPGLNLHLDPITAAVTPPSTPVIWPAPTAPTVKVISVGGQSAPSDPKAQLSGPSADIAIATTNVVTITLQSANLPTNGTVNVYIKPRNASQTILTASLVSGNSSLATWQATTTLLPAYTIIQARAVAP